MMAICSSEEGGGKRLAAARARRVFPAPGGPEIRILWCPATAMDMARLARAWPRIWSRKGGFSSVLVFSTTVLEEGWIGFSPFKWRKSSRRFLTPIRVTPERREAWARFSSGRKIFVIPAVRAASIMLIIP